MLFLMVLHSQAYRDTSYKLLFMLTPPACCGQELTPGCCSRREFSNVSGGRRVVPQLSFVLVQPHEGGKRVCTQRDSDLGSSQSSYTIWCLLLK